MQAVLDTAMAIRSEDWARIDERINAQINSTIQEFQPRGWKKVTHWLREWGLTATAIMAPLSLLLMLIAVGIFAMNGVIKNAEFRTNTEDRLRTIETGINEINTSLGTVQISSFSESHSPDAAKAARTVLSKIRSEHLSLPMETVKSAGEKFLAASKGNPEAWRTTLDLVSYKSGLDSSILKLLPSPTKEIQTHYQGITPPGDLIPQVSVAGVVRVSEAAKFILNGKDLNSGQTMGNQYILVKNGGMIIDDMMLRNVIFCRSTYCL
jgi:hypothetical protein